LKNVSRFSGIKINPAYSGIEYFESRLDIAIWHKYRRDECNVPPWREADKRRLRKGAFFKGLGE